MPRPHSHWLTNAYIFFATPYFAYDVYAMFLCFRYKQQVRGQSSELPLPSTGGAIRDFLHREMLLVLHHVFVVAFCFPASVVRTPPTTAHPHPHT